MYEYAVVGAGIAGSMCAYLLKKRGKSVALIDRGSTFGDASLAAGAFLSPLIGKPNQIKTFLNSSLAFALDFYSKETPSVLTKKGLIRLPIDEDDLALYKSYDYSDIRCSIFPKGSFGFLKPDADRFGAYFFEDAAIVDSNELLTLLSLGVDKHFGVPVYEIKKDGELFLIGDIKAKRVILATGAAKMPISAPYICIRAVCGQRMEVSSVTKIDHNIHKELSISASKKDGRIIIGATHYNCDAITPITSTKEASDELLRSAQKIIKLEDVELIDARCGARAGSSDYQPILGELIDATATLRAQPQIAHGAKIDKGKVIAHNGVFMINGMGARGYVYAPMCAKILVDAIEDGAPIQHQVSVFRRFERWAKRDGASHLT